jgi:hypothetical protein
MSVSFLKLGLGLTPKAGGGEYITINGKAYQRVRGRGAWLVARDGGPLYAIMRTLP